MLCENCDTIYHARCSQSSFKYDHLRNRWLCTDCVVTIPVMYNPFNVLSYDRHDPNKIECNDDIESISKILNSCKVYDKMKFTKSISEQKSNCKESIFSIVFNNLDGNLTNFDSLTVDLAQYTEQFSIIALAETNIDETNKSSFDIPGYQSEYNSKFPGKSKGSGLGIYIAEKFQFTRIEKFCFCTRNLESLFIEVTNFNDQGVPHETVTCTRNPGHVTFAHTLTN